MHASTQDKVSNTYRTRCRSWSDFHVAVFIVNNKIAWDWPISKIWLEISKRLLMAYLVWSTLLQIKSSSSRTNINPTLKTQVRRQKLLPCSFQLNLFMERRSSNNNNSSNTNSYNNSSSCLQEMTRSFWFQLNFVWLRQTLSQKNELKVEPCFEAAASDAEGQKDLPTTTTSATPTPTTTASRVQLRNSLAGWPTGLCYKVFSWCNGLRIND